MDFKDLQNDLRDRKLNITEYFMWMFRVLRVFILENKLWVMFLVLTNILTGIMPLNFVKKYIFISIALVFYGRIFIFISYAKVLHRIESTESKYKFKSLILKYLKLLLVMIFIVPFVAVLREQLKFAIKILIKNQILNTQIIGLVFLILTLVLIPYFTQIYTGRDMNIWESFKYNLILARKNKLRIGIPIIILTLLSGSLSMLTYYYNNFEQLYIRNIVIILSASISSIFEIIFVIMYVIVFLNVENDYLKSCGKNVEKIMKSKI